LKDEQQHRSRLIGVRFSCTEIAGELGCSEPIVERTGTVSHVEEAEEAA
jgi:hypothetical protein